MEPKAGAEVHHRQGLAEVHHGQGFSGKGLDCGAKAMLVELSVTGAGSPRISDGLTAGVRLPEMVRIGPLLALEHLRGLPLLGSA